jgi:hypothetical protein
MRMRLESSRCFLLDIKGLLSKTRPDTAGRIYTKEVSETRIAVDLWITGAGPWINPWTASCPQAYPQPCSEAGYPQAPQPRRRLARLNATMEFARFNATKNVHLLWQVRSV